MKDKIKHKQKNSPKEGKKIVHNPKFRANFFGHRIGILALIVSLLSVPIVNALSVDQSFGFLGSWRWFVVNAFIVFVILFILQATLVPNNLKQDKEKTVVWIITIILCLGISWFVSSSGYIWQHEKIGKIFNIHTPVNAAIIGLVIIVLLPLLKVKLEGSTKVGMWILVGVVSIAIAVNIGNHFIWDLQIYNSIKDFLFGDRGILTVDPKTGNYRLMVFITMSIVWAWVLSTLKVGETNNKNNRIAYVLAVLIASQMARGGLSLDSAIKLVQISAILILGYQLGNSWGTKIVWLRILAYALIFGLVEYATAAVSPKYTLFGDIFGGLKFAGITGLKALGILALLIGIGIGLFFLNRTILSRLFGSSAPPQTGTTTASTTDTTAQNANQGGGGREEENV